MMLDDAEERQLSGPIGELVPFSSRIRTWWRSTMISMSLSVSVRREDRSRPRIRHRPREQRVKATADHGRWRRTLPVQGSDRGFGALHLENLERYAIDDQNLPFDAVTAELWRVIDRKSTRLDKRDSPLVLGSKALHHVLPELVPP